MKKTTIRHTVYTMTVMAFRAAPLRFCLVNVLGIFQALVLAGNTPLLSGFVDELAEAVGKGESGGKVLKWGGLYVAGVIGYQVFNSLLNYVLEEYLRICDEKFRFEYNAVISGLPPVKFEGSRNLDEIQKAAAGRDIANVFVFHLIGIIDMVPPYLIFLSVYLSRLNPWLVLCIAGSFLPAVFTFYMQKNIYTEHEDTAAPVRRRYRAYKDCIVGRQYLKETRIRGASGYFFQKLSEEWERLCREEAKVSWKGNLLDTVNNAVGLAGYLGALALLVGSVLTGRITVGAFAAVYNSLGKISDMAFAMVCGFIGSTVSNLPAVENYVHFLESRDSAVGEPSGGAGDLVMTGVSFSYPDAACASVEDVSLRIPHGQHVALVGGNGAGKSTLAKLMLGIYVPESGEVRWEGCEGDCGESCVSEQGGGAESYASDQGSRAGTWVSGRGNRAGRCEENRSSRAGKRATDMGSKAVGFVADQSVRSERFAADQGSRPGGCQGRISAVFQDFARYQMTVADNVRIGDMACEDDTAAVLRDTGLERQIVEERDTLMLSREFGGIEFSGGMWQQVAIARGRYRRNGFIVMDEPTAAIDPIEESAVYNEILAMAKGRTAVIVSHRLGSARLADRILVMEKGRIVGDGSHEELLAGCGIYKEMWEAQACNYQ